MAARRIKGAAQERFNAAIPGLDLAAAVQERHAESAVFKQDTVSALGLPQFVQALKKLLILLREGLLLLPGEACLLEDELGLHTHQRLDGEHAKISLAAVEQRHIVVKGIAFAREGLLQDVEQGGVPVNAEVALHHVIPR